MVGLVTSSTDNYEEQWEVDLAKLPKVPTVGEPVTVQITAKTLTWKFPRPVAQKCKPTDREVMQQIMQVLGPKPVCACAGCSWETGEAIRLLRSVGIRYKARKKRSGPAHEPALEALGNEIYQDPLKEARKQAEASLQPLLRAVAKPWCMTHGSGTDPMCYECAQRDSEHAKSHPKTPQKASSKPKSAKTSRKPA
jgi:hypothetical protein